jgi:hypothetical protein
MRYPALACLRVKTANLGALFGSLAGPALSAMGHGVATGHEGFGGEEDTPAPHPLPQVDVPGPYTDPAQRAPFGAMTKHDLDLGRFNQVLDMNLDPRFNDSAGKGHQWSLIKGAPDDGTGSYLRPTP